MVSARSPRLRLQHILDNIDGILTATTDLTAAQVMGSFVMVRAVERAVQIISEAAKELPQEMRDSEPDVPWQEIIRIGNILRHEYYRIREDVLVDILQTDLPLLRPAVVRLLEKTQASGT
jgi:uncharacterized protein with HEPN domain